MRDSLNARRTHNLAALVLGLARLGYRGPVRERALSSLVAWASEHDVDTVLSWVREDSGLLFVPSWQFPMPWNLGGKEEHVFHNKRRWCVAQVESAEVLAEKLTEHTWTLCTAFALEGHLFLNDSTSEDGAQEYAVLKTTEVGVYIQVESITFGWCKPDRALELIREVLAGKFDTAGTFGPVKPKLDTPDKHGRCPLCA